MLFQLHITLNGIPLSPSAPQFVQCLHQTQLQSCQLLSEELPWAIAIPQKQSPSRKFSENHWKRGESMGCHDIAMTFWRKKTEDMEDVHSPSTASFVTRRLVCTSRSSAFAQRRKGTATFEASSTTGYSTNTLPSGKLA